MIRKSIATALKSGIVAILLFVLLFANGVWRSFSGSAGSTSREIAAVFHDSETQWMIFLCLEVYFTTFLFFRFRTTPGFWRVSNPGLWLAAMVLIGAIFYTLTYSPSTDTLTLLAGAVLGQGVAVWAGFNAHKPFPLSAFRFPLLPVSLLIILLALASVWNVDSGHSYEYRNHARWSGPWDNPNISGLLMGVGVSLALGLGISRWKMVDRSWKSGVRKYAIVILFLFAAGLMARGLLHSYSRGAWLATLCGLAFLTFRAIKDSHFQQIRTIRWIRTNKVSLVVITCAVAVLVFWQFQQPQHPLARRASSVVNVNDFSWRNRIAAWEGTLQMMAEKAWFGFGWDQPEPLYDHYYRAPKVVEGLAIQLNDYFMLGATLGIPALFCFGMYLWLSLGRNSGFRIQKPEVGDGQDAGPSLDSGLWTLDSLRATCRAGAIVLLVGFWFDGGLFKLATASTFWILLELGSDELHKVAAKQTNEVP